MRSCPSSPLLLLSLKEVLAASRLHLDQMCKVRKQVGKASFNSEERGKINTCLLKLLLGTVLMQTFPSALFSVELSTAGSVQVSITPPGRCSCRILLWGRRKPKGVFVHNLRIPLLSDAFRHIFKWQKLSVLILSEFIPVAAFRQGYTVKNDCL